MKMMLHAFGEFLRTKASMEVKKSPTARLQAQGKGTFPLLLLVALRKACSAGKEHFTLWKMDLKIFSANEKREKPAEACGASK